MEVYKQEGSGSDAHFRSLTAMQTQRGTYTEAARGQLSGDYQVRGEEAGTEAGNMERNGRL